VRCVREIVFVCTWKKKLFWFSQNHNRSRSAQNAWVTSLNVINNLLWTTIYFILDGYNNKDTRTSIYIWEHDGGLCTSQQPIRTTAAKGVKQMQDNTIPYAYWRRRMPKDICTEQLLYRTLSFVSSVTWCQFTKKRLSNMHAWQHIREGDIYQV